MLIPSYRLRNMVFQYGVHSKWKITNCLIFGRSLPQNGRRTFHLPTTIAGNSIFLKQTKFLQSGQLITDNTIGLKSPNQKCRILSNGRLEYCRIKIQAT